MLKVFIGVGHGGSDPGATGFLTEKTVNLVQAIACREYLIAHGINVLISRLKDENCDINKRISMCNAFNPNLAIDIHNNAGGGDGAEFFYHFGGGQSKILAENLEKEILSIGQNSRGIKTKINNNNSDYFAFIRETACPAVIAEGCFVDNETDAAICDSIPEQQEFGKAYARAILKTLGVEDKPKYYRVQVGAFVNEQNAIALKDTLKNKGYDDAFIVYA
jgi:N-acetylmuramoyl-L-alanine amidase